MPTQWLKLQGRFNAIGLSATRAERTADSADFDGLGVPAPVSHPKDNSETGARTTQPHKVGPVSCPLFTACAARRAGQSRPLRQSPEQRVPRTLAEFNPVANMAPAAFRSRGSRHHDVVMNGPPPRCWIRHDLVRPALVRPVLIGFSLVWPVLVRPILNS